MTKYFMLACVAGLLTHTIETHSQTVTATGTSMKLEEARSNSYVSAHFQCNRKGLWADLTTLEEVKVDTKSRPISGGRVEVKFYDVTVTSECGPNYLKEVPAE